MTPSPLTFGSLFAGIGGLDLGLERAGMTCKWQVEIDDYARRVLAKHWPNVRRWDDVRTWPQPDTECVDLICGGFPCQDISYANVNGKGLQGERSGLFFEFMRIVREMGPKFVVLENVAALLDRGMGDVLGTLASLGYDAEWHCIPASAIGCLIERDRAFILARSQRLNGEGLAKRWINLHSSSSRRRWNTTARGNASNGRSRPIQTNTTQTDMEACRSARMEKRQEHGSQSKLARIADGIPHRVDRNRGLGNAVVPQVAEWIGRQIVQSYKDSNPLSR